MKQNPLLIRVLLLLFVVYLSCNKTDDSDSNKVYTPEYVTATIAGRVTDDAKKPVSGALVKAGGSSATTDIDGAFVINDVSIDKTAAFVKVEKDGFFLGTKTIVATAGKSNQVAIKLIKKTLAGNITPASGGTVTVPSNGGTIAIEANGIVNPATNAAYTGTVAVSAFFINPEATDFNEIMPGTLRGITTNNQETGLQSFGMMAVELTGTAGEKLQLAAGKKATLRFPIPTGLQGEAPATIPLWYLDEATGLWKEEGSATRQGAEYVGSVNHFSFWNCDAPFPVIDFTGIIRSPQGSNIEGAEVEIVVPAGGGTGGSLSANGFTNADGVFTGKLPSNKTLQLKVYNKCRTLLHTQSVGPFNATADLGVITVTTAVSQVTISGTVKNCFNANVANGFVMIKLEDIFYNVPVTNGSFTKTITRCNSNSVTATLSAFDQSKQQSGNEVGVTVSGATVNAGTLVACGSTADTYIRYIIDGVSYEVLPPADSVRYYISPSTTITTIEGKRQGKVYEDVVIIFTGGQSVGPRPVVISDFFFGGPNIHWERITNFNADILEYGSAGGGYVSGTFSTILRDSLNTKQVPVSLSFRAKRP